MGVERDRGRLRLSIPVTRNPELSTHGDSLRSRTRLFEVEVEFEDAARILER
jgi:hypothetical protein